MIKTKDEILMVALGVRHFESLPDFVKTQLYWAMDEWATLTEPAQLQQHSVMQAEGSDVCEGAAVGNGADGKGVSAEENCPKCGSKMIVTTDRIIYCDFIGCDYSRAI